MNKVEYIFWPDIQVLRDTLLWKDDEDRSKVISIGHWGHVKPKKQVIELDGKKLIIPTEPTNRHLSKHYNSGAYRAGYCAGYEKAKRKYAAELNQMKGESA